MAFGACNRSWTKNSTSVAGMALAIPLSTNTPSSRLNAGRVNGNQIWLVCAVIEACGRGARVQASQPAISATQNRATVAPRPRTRGVTEASTTPISPRPSRHATMRLRWASSPPNMAPQDWCATLRPL